MLLQSLRALCLAPGGSGRVWKYLEALVTSPGVSGRIACGFRTELYFADERPTLDITPSNRYQVRAQVEKVKSHFIQSARDDIAELYDLHRFESNAERLEFIDSLLADNKYLFPLAEGVEGGVRGPNPTQRVSKVANKWPASTLLCAGSNPAVYLHQILSSGE